MKMNKLILVAAGMLATSCAFAGLNIYGHNNDKITVKCGKSLSSLSDTGVPVPPNGSVKNLPWIGIAGFLGGATGVCAFSDPSGTQLGYANLTVTASTGNVTAVTTSSSTYSISFEGGYKPGVTGAQSDISVDITKN